MIINVENDTMLGRNNDSIYATKFYVMQKQIDKLQQENKKQKEVIDKAIEFTNKNWGSWCSNHCKYMTELQSILKEVSK